MTDPQSMLAEGVAGLADDMKKMTETALVVGKRLDAHQSLINRTMDNYRRALIVVAIGLVLDLSLTVFGGYLFIHERENARQLAQVQQRTSLTILCPLYEVFIESIKANPNPPNTTPELAKLRQDAAKVIQDGYKNLGCKP